MYYGWLRDLESGKVVEVEGNSNDERVARLLAFRQAKVKLRKPKLKKFQLILLKQQ